MADFSFLLEFRKNSLKSNEQSWKCGKKFTYHCMYVTLAAHARAGVSRSHAFSMALRVNPRSACAATIGLFVRLSVRPSVRASSRTTGYEAANEGHQRLLSNENIDMNVAIFLKRLRSRDMA